MQYFILKVIQDSERCSIYVKSQILNSISLLHFMHRHKEMVWEAAVAQDCSWGATAVVTAFFFTKNAFPLRISGVRRNDFGALELRIRWQCKVVVTDPIGRTMILTSLLSTLIHQVGVVDEFL